MIKLLLYLWQLPQEIIGFFLVLILKGNYSRFPENWADKLGGINSRI